MGVGFEAASSRAGIVAGRMNVEFWLLGGINRWGLVKIVPYIGMSLFVPWKWAQYV